MDTITAEENFAVCIATEGVSKHELLPKFGCGFWFLATIKHFFQSFHFTQLFRKPRNCLGQWLDKCFMGVASFITLARSVHLSTMSWMGVVLFCTDLAFTDRHWIPSCPRSQPYIYRIIICKKWPWVPNANINERIWTEKRLQGLNFRRKKHK